MLPYIERRSVFNRSEAALFVALNESLRDSFFVFAKMRVIDFIAPTSRLKWWKYRIWAKHVDFLICDKHFKPALAVELNGGSHLNPARVARDAFISRVYSVAGLPFTTVVVGSDFSAAVRDIRAQLEKPPHA